MSAVVRPCTGLGVELHRKDGLSVELDAGDRAVVKVFVGDGHPLAALTRSPG